MTDQETIIKLENKVAELEKVLASYDCVINALPKHQLVLISNGITSAYQGYSILDLQAQLSERAQEIKRSSLFTPKYALIEPTGSLESRQGRICGVCSLSLSPDESYAHVIFFDKLGFVCHIDCIPVEAMLLY